MTPGSKRCSSYRSRSACALANCASSPGSRGPRQRSHPRVALGEPDGDVKTPKSKRSLVLPKRAVAVLQAHKKRQAAERLAAGAAWQDNNLVFCHEDGRMYTSDALNWRFGKMTRRAGIGHWHAHEGRHTAVSIMSSNGVPLQEISDTVGHKSTHVTETVYRHVIVPAIRGGATVMDQVFSQTDDGDGQQGANAAP